MPQHSFVGLLQESGIAPYGFFDTTGIRGLGDAALRREHLRYDLLLFARRYLPDESNLSLGLDTSRWSLLHLSSLRFGFTKFCSKLPSHLGNVFCLAQCFGSCYR